MEGNSIAKKTCVKVGGEDSVFINDLKIIDPYAPGIDPVYLAGFVPATDEPQTKMQDEGAVAPPETSSAADENAANPTEYATDEMDGFSGLEAPDEGLRP
jgi:hypothetical protein